MTTSLMMLTVLVGYFILLLLIARWSGRGKDATSNDAFFRAGRRAPWAMVAFGMIGASISGVSLISVPGWVTSTQMSYLQMCMGFFFGYLLVAFVLLPVYYKLKLTSIYGYLRQRFGERTHKTGAVFFLLSKLTGAAARLYLVCIVLFTFITRPLMTEMGPQFGALYGEISFAVTVAIILLLIWLYTRRSGIAAIVRTDALQTLCLLLAVVGIFWAVCQRLDLNIAEVWSTIANNDMSRVFVWDGDSKQNFWRQFFSGIFIVIVMTGLDQDMMQKNLTCSNLRDAQKDMCAYGIAFVPVNALFLGLGVLLYYYCNVAGIDVPQRGDELLPMLVSGGYLGSLVIIPFTIGIVAAAFSSADSAITALTTSVCVDIFERNDDAVAFRKRVHLFVVGAFFLCILAFRIINSSNAIDAIYTMAGYTYGPLLGLFAYGLLTKRNVHDRYVPYVALISPIICGLLDHFAPILWGYTFGYELLMLNGLLTALGLAVLHKR